MKIMFVCHGNICRSPMAEFIFKDMLQKNGITDISASSSATSSEELGNPVYPPAQRELLSHGISCKGKAAVKLTAADYEKYDLFICMDNRNIKNIGRIFKDTEGKVKKLMDYTSRGGEVADPWYTGDFERTYEDIYEGCRCLLEEIKG